MYSNKRFSSLSGLPLFVVKNDCMRKKGKGHLVEFYMTLYTASHTPFKIVAEQSQTTTLTCKVCLVLNHPEIILIFLLNSR